ncbi:hypothetical protein OSO01_19380 [Oceanobacillus sojae]|uniref:Uncharacterized protein n=1 Tax=Oceanobacillus sojae TaxID=582851 RepID=A0A511ZIC8_9BACI|nr:hypothetical protein OSO01_19380 [Oceanobacillus sojae]
MISAYINHDRILIASFNDMTSHFIPPEGMYVLFLVEREGVLCTPYLFSNLNNKLDKSFLIPLKDFMVWIAWISFSVKV